MEPRFLTAPNLLTLSRLPLAAVVWIRPESPLWVLGLMAVAALTDVLDGWLERRLRRRHGLAPEARTAGAWLDPLCDKTFVLSVIGAVAFARTPPPWVLALVAAREILQIPPLAVYLVRPALRARLRYDFTASLLGKATTTAQFFAIGAILLGHPSTVPFALAAGTLGTAAAVLYFLRGLARRRPLRAGE
jgi:phosphatidylglycerophosphate synthase